MQKQLQFWHINLMINSRLRGPWYSVYTCMNLASRKKTLLGESRGNPISSTIVKIAVRNGYHLKEEDILFESYQGIFSMSNLPKVIWKKFKIRVSWFFNIKLTRKRALHAQMSHNTVCKSTVSTKKTRRTLVK